MSKPAHGLQCHAEPRAEASGCCGTNGFTRSLMVAAMYGFAAVAAISQALNRSKGVVAALLAASADTAWTLQLQGEGGSDGAERETIAPPC